MFTVYLRSNLCLSWLIKRNNRFEWHSTIASVSLGNELFNSKAFWIDFFYRLNDIERVIMRKQTWQRFIANINRSEASAEPLVHINCKLSNCCFLSWAQYFYDQKVVGKFIAVLLNFELIMLHIASSIGFLLQQFPMFREFLLFLFGHLIFILWSHYFVIAIYF